MARKKDVAVGYKLVVKVPGPELSRTLTGVNAWAETSQVIRDLTDSNFEVTVSRFIGEI